MESCVSAFGAKPKKYQSSIENMYRTILNGESIRRISTIVDIYNYISLKHTASLGGDDPTKLKGDVVLTFAKGDEPYYELNTQELKHPKEGEVIYTDGEQVLCRRWNWRQGFNTRIDKESTKAILVIEALEPFSKEDIKTIADELKAMIKKYCGGSSEFYLLSADNLSADIN